MLGNCLIFDGDIDFRTLPAHIPPNQPTGTRRPQVGAGPECCSGRRSAGSAADRGLAAGVWSGGGEEAAGEPLEGPFEGPRHRPPRASPRALRRAAPPPAPLAAVANESALGIEAGSHGQRAGVSMCEALSIPTPTHPSIPSLLSPSHLLASTCTQKHTHSSTRLAADRSPLPNFRRPVLIFNSTAKHRVWLSRCRSESRKAIIGGLMDPPSRHMDPTLIRVLCDGKHTGFRLRA